ncbi:hypothetical protein V8G54_036578 [Vigna mungo]|uniref:Uncharacterized protein n=1 Tax=Vigna mungo TaxID=3915 RepID=A0AAQ3MIQ7_VIGMU
MYKFYCIRFLVGEFNVENRKVESCGGEGVFDRAMVFPPKIVSVVDEEGSRVRADTPTQSTMGSEQPDKEHRPLLPQQQIPIETLQKKFTPSICRAKPSTGSLSTHAASKSTIIAAASPNA